MAERTASASWSGGLPDGQGRVSLDTSGVGSYEVSWPRRAEDAEGVTSPEEMLAAALASCFVMALSKELSDDGGSNPQLSASVTVTLVPGTGITDVALQVSGSADGLSDEQFALAAEKTKAGCPVWGLFTGGSAELTLEVKRS